MKRKSLVLAACAALLMALLCTAGPLAAQTVVATIPVGNQPLGVGFNPATNKIYVANSGSSNVSVINGATDTTMGLPIGLPLNPNDVGVNPKTNKIYISHFAGNSVSVINGATDTVTGIPIAVGTNPRGIRANPETNKIYVANSGSSNVSVINGATDTTMVPIGLPVNPYDLGVNPKTNKIYVTHDSNNTVSVIDGASDTVLGIPIGVGTTPHGVGVNTATNKIYIANSGSNNVSVINGATDTVQGLPISVSWPRNISVNPLTNMVYVTNGGTGGKVTVINGATDTVVATVPVGASPRGVDANPTTGKVYVADDVSNNVSVIYDPPVPTTTSISPVSATAGGGDFTLTVNGTGFINSSVVRWNGADRPTTYVSDKQLTTVIGASDVSCGGTARVTVFNHPPGGGESNAQTFTVQPVVSELSPSSGPPGTRVTVKGTGFGDSRGSGVKAQAASSVSFNGKEATDYPKWSNSEIVCRVPEGATTGPVTVTVNGVSSNNDKIFTIASPTWYLAEGTTAWGFSTYISIENPNNETVTADVTYMPTGWGNATEEVSLPPNSQTTITNDHLLSVMGGQRDFSTRVECRDKTKTISVDRTMTWTGTGARSPEAHNSVGVTSPDTTWYLPEGSCNWGFECWLLIQNPNSSQATCRVTYMIEGSDPKTVEHKVDPNSRASFSMETDLGGKADASIKVDSDIPVIPERAMYRNNRREGHDSIGTTTPASDYYLAEGTTAWGFTTYVLIQNPNGSPTDVSVTFMTSNGPQALPTFNMPANSRKTVRVNDIKPPAYPIDVSNIDFSTRVHGSQPIIAERAMYWNGGGDSSEACHDSIGMATSHTSFYLPDGESTIQSDPNGRETFTLVANPNDSSVDVEVTYLKAGGGGPVVVPASIPAESRRTFKMFEAGISGRASVAVTSKTSGKKIMVERSMYWNSRGAGTDTIGGYSD